MGIFKGISDAKNKITDTKKKLSNEVNGFMDSFKKDCPVCGGKINVSKRALEGEICYPCALMCPKFGNETMDTLRYHYRKNRERAEIFRPTDRLRGRGIISVVIDDTHKLFYIGDCNVQGMQIYYSFDEVAGYRCKQMGGRMVTRSKGTVGRALVGGALAGGVGAIIGGATSRRETLVENGVEMVYIDFVTHAGRTTRNIIPIDGLFGFLDKCMADAKNENQNPALEQPQVDIADQILKFKNLLDIGAITEEEYEKKKQELLSK
jgi:hypothetical protein|nr:MAG TPA: Gas vesicle protein G [Caudoviricetes sp.]